MIYTIVYKHIVSMIYFKLVNCTYNNNIITKSIFHFTLKNNKIITWKMLDNTILLLLLGLGLQRLVK